MKVIVNKNGGNNMDNIKYKGDILFRIYYNQDPHPKPNEVYAFEILTRNGFESSLEGRYTSEHPQGAQNVLEKLLNEVAAIPRGILEISNELEIYNPGVFSPTSREWFDCAIKSALEGFRKYN